MTIAPILTLARKEAGDDVEAQRDYLARLCLVLGWSVSPGYLRAAPRTGPSEEERRKAKIEPVLIPGEVNSIKAGE